MREAVRLALIEIACRFSDEAPSIDLEALRRRYTALDAWPADAELALVILAWALGSGFSIREFSRAVNRLTPDFAAAAAAIPIGPTPAGIAIGDAARRALRNAAHVLRWNLDGSILYWPTDLSLCPGSCTLNLSRPSAL